MNTAFFYGNCTGFVFGFLLGMWTLIIGFRYISTHAYYDDEDIDNETGRDRRDDD